MKVSEYELTENECKKKTLEQLNNCVNNVIDEMNDCLMIGEDMKHYDEMEKWLKLLKKEIKHRDYYFIKDKSDDNVYLNKDTTVSFDEKWCFETKDEAEKVINEYNTKYPGAWYSDWEIEFHNALRVRQKRSENQIIKDCWSLIDFLREQNDYVDKKLICLALNFEINENPHSHDICSYLWTLKNYINQNVETFGYQIVSNSKGDMKIPNEAELVESLKKEKIRLAKQWKRLWMKEKSLKLINQIDIDDYILKVVKDN